MGGIFLRSIGAARVAVGGGLMNLVYEQRKSLWGNLKRIEVLIHLRIIDIAKVGTFSTPNAA